MVLFTAVTAAVGIGLTLFGEKKKREAAKKQDRLQRAQLARSQQLDIESQKRDLATQQVFNEQAAIITGAQRRISAASARAERAREQQLTLEARRARRSTIRQAIVAQGTSVSEQIGAGIGLGSSIGFGARAGLTAETAFQNLGSFQAQQLGQNVFAENRSILGAQSESNLAQARIDQASRSAQFANRAASRQANIFNRQSQAAGIGLNRAGTGFSALGQQLTRSAPTIGKIGTTLFSGRRSNTGTAFLQPLTTTVTRG